MKLPLSIEANVSSTLVYYHTHCKVLLQCSEKSKGFWILQIIIFSFWHTLIDQVKLCISSKIWDLFDYTFKGVSKAHWWHTIFWAPEDCGSHPDRGENLSFFVLELQSHDCHVFELLNFSKTMKISKETNKVSKQAHWYTYLDLDMSCLLDWC